MNKEVAPVIKLTFLSVVTTQSLWIWGTLVVAGWGFLGHVDPAKIGSALASPTALRFQFLVYSAWAFMVIQGVLWAGESIETCLHRGLSFIWGSRGVRGAGQALGILLALLAVVAMVTGLLFGAAWLTDGEIPRRLFLEQWTLVLAAGAVLYPVAMLLSALFGRVFGSGMTLILFVVLGVTYPMFREAISASASQSVISFLVPNLAIFFRPGALIFDWPPLDLLTLLRIVFYASAWSGALIFLCHFAFAKFRRS